MCEGTITLNHDYLRAKWLNFFLFKISLFLSLSTFDWLEKARMLAEVKDARNGAFLSVGFFIGARVKKCCVMKVASIEYN